MLRKFALLLGAVGALRAFAAAFADTPCCVVGAIVPDAGQDAASVSVGNYGGNNYLGMAGCEQQPACRQMQCSDTHAYEEKSSWLPE